MSSYANSDNFKPGERWLATFTGTDIVEVYCLEWSPSGCYCLVKYARSSEGQWVDQFFDLLERLPDESSVNQTAAAAGAVEGDSESCQREDCRRIRQEITQRIIHEAAQEIPEGQTFTVTTQAESAAKSDNHGTD